MENNNTAAKIEIRDVITGIFRNKKMPLLI